MENFFCAVGVAHFVSQGILANILLLYIYTLHTWLFHFKFNIHIRGNE